MLPTSILNFSTDFLKKHLNNDLKTNCKKSYSKCQNLKEIIIYRAIRLFRFNLLSLLPIEDSNIKCDVIICMIIICKRIHSVTLPVAIVTPPPFKLGLWNQISRALIRSHAARVCDLNVLFINFTLMFFFKPYKNWKITDCLLCTIKVLKPAFFPFCVRKFKNFCDLEREKKFFGGK